MSEESKEARKDEGLPFGEQANGYSAGRNIFQRMMLATADIGSVGKNLSVNLGKGSYKAVGEADVLYAVKQVERKYGIYSYPYQREIIESGVIDSSDGSTYQRKTFQMRVEVTYRFVNVDKPEEFIDITAYGDGMDTGDKSPGKALTYADKYALLKAYKIVTGDDPDQFPSITLSEGDKVTVNAAKPPAKASATVPQLKEPYDKELTYEDVMRSVTRPEPQRAVDPLLKTRYFDLCKRYGKEKCAEAFKAKGYSDFTKENLDWLEARMNEDKAFPQSGNDGL